MTYKAREKFSAYVPMKGGVFTPATRRRLLKYSPGRDGQSQSERDFRLRMRRSVKSALKDFELFLATAEQKDVKKVMTEEALRPFVDALLWYPFVDSGKPKPKNSPRRKPDDVMARVANMMIHRGFDYLGKMKPDLAILSGDQIDKALVLSDTLAGMYLPSPR
jgi:hypothetical protein